MLECCCGLCTCAVKSAIKNAHRTGTPRSKATNSTNRGPNRSGVGHAPGAERRWSLAAEGFIELEAPGEGAAGPPPGKNEESHAEESEHELRRRT